MTIKPPNFQEAIFLIKGTSPLVIHRFNKKIKKEFRDKIGTGKPARSKRKTHEPQDVGELFNEARYVSQEGWDGFNATAIRGSMISVCSLVGVFKTVAKLTVFVQPDGWDAEEPQIPLVRIYGEAKQQEDIGRTSTGVAMLIIRAAYYKWSAKVRLRWDADQLTLEDVTNLLSRAGQQCGICEGRYNSTASVGMGWGLFEVERS